MQKDSFFQIPKEQQQTLEKWREKIEAIRLNINVPHDVEPEFIIEQQNGIL